MSHHPPIIPARHSQGLAAYRAGLSLAELNGVLREIDAMHEKPELTNEEHDEIAHSGPSLIAGFADGLIDDIRLIANTKRGLRA
jgi:hypothetical protein